MFNFLNDDSRRLNGTTPEYAQQADASLLPHVRISGYVGRASSSLLTDYITHYTKASGVEAPLRVDISPIELKKSIIN
jgi:hypothetical protein